MRQHDIKCHVLHIILIQKVSLPEGFYLKMQIQHDIRRHVKTMFYADTRHINKPKRGKQQQNIYTKKEFIYLNIIFKLKPPPSNDLLFMYLNKLLHACRASLSTAKLNCR